ncbi:MAG: hypothetical protein ABL890_04785 [Candidatus Peribacteraceae bacterium]
MSPSKSSTEFGSVWLRLSQFFVALFFITASYYKLFDAFFFTKSAPLKRSMEWWIGNGWPLVGMRQVMQFVVQYDWLVACSAAFVISCQMTGGVLLFANIWKRFAGYVLLIVQLSVLFGVFHGGLGFQTFIGLSIWLAVFYILSGRMTQRKWRLMSYWLIFYGFLILMHRYRMDDPWPSAFSWQYKHYIEDVMSISVSLKQLIIVLGKHPLAPYFWAGSWWLQLFVTFMLLTRFRIVAGIAWMLILIFHEWIWLNGLTSEGVLWILTGFVWLSFEDASREKWGVVRLLPRWRDIAAFVQSARKWLNAK